MRDFYARGCFPEFKQFLNLPDVFLGLPTRLGQELKKVIKRSQKGTKSLTTGTKGVQKNLSSKNYSEAQGSWEKIHDGKINPHDVKIHPHNYKINPQHLDYFDGRIKKVHGLLPFATVGYGGWISSKMEVT